MVTQKPILACKAHGKLFIELNQVIKSGISYGIQRYKCRACMKEIHAKNYLKNKDKIKQAHETYKKKDPKKHREMKNASNRKMRGLNIEESRKRTLAYDKAHPLAKSIRQKRYKDKQVEEVHDMYVKQQLVAGTGLKHSDIPDSLVAFKKALIIGKRKIKAIIEQNKINDTLEKIYERQDKKHRSVKR